MIFKCKNCGGNTVYSPEQHRMYCPYCQSFDSDEKLAGEEPTTFQCQNCGGELQIRDYLSASRCPYCEDYIIFDERVSGQYRPKLMIPFLLGKDKIKELMRKKFKSCVFAPDDFCSDVKLDTMTGMYVPFWMYDYRAKGFFDGLGRIVRTWVSGGREFTETKTYHIVRDLEATFEKVPADASYLMPDATMDLMEPYRYGQLEDFKECFLSGFSAEHYNMEAEEAKGRAESKSKADMHEILNNSLQGYTGVQGRENERITLEQKEHCFTLLPVWIYRYIYINEAYIFYINGQTGKIVGKVPLSKPKVFAYGATVFACLSAIMVLLKYLFVFL